MTNGSKILGAIAGTALSFVAVTAATIGTARAFTIGGTLSEQAFQDLGVEVPWAAESRIGGASTTEVNIHDSANTVQNRVEANYDNWVSGEAVDFALAFDSIANTLTYTVGGVAIEKTNILEDNFSDLYIRTTARTEGSSILIDNLFLQDESMQGGIAAIADSACAGGIGCGYFDSEYLHMGDIVGDFILTGKSTLTWGDTKPRNSQLAYQIKLVEGSGGGVDVPEPASISLLSLGLVGLLAAGKRRKEES